VLLVSKFSMRDLGPYPRLLLTAKAKVKYPRLPDYEVLRELIGLYILYIHEKPHALFHEVTLIR
jgi:hypothetical protein